MALEIETRIKPLSILLTLVAGFCYTVTLVAANSLFSAHVTGNFILFVYDVVHHVDAQAWTKLVSFPVFVAAVVAVRWISARAPSRYTLLLWEAGLLLAAGLLVLATLVWHDCTVLLMQLAAMLVVFAMGLQNAFGRLFAKETYGLTTVMTGNVTQATLDVVAWLRTLRSAAEQTAGLHKQLLVLCAFLSGCLVGAIAAKLAGLVVAGAGVALLIVALGWHRQAQREVSGSALLS